MERYGSEIRNQLHNLFNHRQVNILVTAAFIFVSTYIAFVACIGQNIVHPLADITRSSFSNNALNEFVQTTMSLFIMLVLGLAAGRLFYYIHLPPLLGSLLVGIALINIPGINKLFWVNSYWDFAVRQFAFILIMLRAAIAVCNHDQPRNAPVLLTSLGLVATLLEAGAVVLASHFIFDFPIAIAIIFGLLLAASSPAVVTPAMLQLQNSNLGTDKSIPSLIMAATSIDNLCMIIAASVAIGVAFSEDPVMETIVRTVGEIVVSAVIGLVIGWALWWFPRRADTYTHLSRVFLLCSISSALIFGSLALNFPFAGIIAVIVMTVIASKHWKLDNEKKMYVEERSLAIIWNLFFQPLLFVLIGMKFEIVQLESYTLRKNTGHGVLSGLAIIGIGIGVRILSILFLTMCSGLKFREQLVFVFSFLPKATVQAALAPALLAATSTIPELEPWAQLVLNTCIFAMLITTPIAQLFLDLACPKLLKSKFIQTVQISPEDTYLSNQKVDDGLEHVHGTPGSYTFKQFKAIYERHGQNLEQQERSLPPILQSIQQGMYDSPKRETYGSPVGGNGYGNGSSAAPHGYGNQALNVDRFPPPQFGSAPDERKTYGYHF